MKQPHRLFGAFMTEVSVDLEQLQVISYALSLIANGIWFSAGLAVFRV